MEIIYKKLYKKGLHKVRFPFKHCKKKKNCMSKNNNSSKEKLTPLSRKNRSEASADQESLHWILLGGSTIKCWKTGHRAAQSEKLNVSLPLKISTTT